MTHSPEHRSWRSMKERCNCPTSNRYASYGGRGIRVCERWLKFSNFFEDMGERPENTSLDRIDPNGNYEPGNCRWANSIDQGRSRRDCWWLMFNGSRRHLIEVAKEIGITAHALRERIRRGWPEKDLFLPRQHSGGWSARGVRR
jgi:hypothetical protein